MTAPLAFALLSIAAALGLLFAERAASLRLIWIFKPVAALGFVLACATSGALGHAAGRVLLAGMVLGLIGDVFLIMKHDKRMFLAGLVSFLLGHVAYVVAFALRGVELRAVVIASVVLVVPALVVGRWLWPHAGRMRGAVVAYIVVISSMVAAAIGARAAGDTVLVVVGAILFYLSDLGVARERFVERAFVNKLVGQPLYFAGQLVLALGVAGPVVRG